MRARGRKGRRAFAAVDLGTNNCRLLIAEPHGAGFRVLDGFSRIVRLGEGLAAASALSEAAMERTTQALRQCAKKMADWPIVAQRCIATQACRTAANGAAFLAQVERDTGLEFSVISPREEAELAVLGCAALIDREAEAALVIDIGGGSTELCWVDAGSGRIAAWTSLPVGVVTLAERFGDGVDQDETYAAVVGDLRERIAAFAEAGPMRAAFEQGRAHFLGTSGAVTSLAAVMLGLPRYRRRLVDGVWMTVAETRAVADRLRRAGRVKRARNGCIGPDRADLVVPGAAILEALFQEWPAARIRVADRGLREGMLTTLMADAGARA